MRKTQGKGIVNWISIFLHLIVGRFEVLRSSYKMSSEIDPSNLDEDPVVRELDVYVTEMKHL